MLSHGTNWVLNPDPGPEDWWYTAPEPEGFASGVPFPKHFENDWLRIHRSGLVEILKPRYSWDGCTAWPKRWETDGTVWSSKWHDVIWQFAEEIAKATGLTLNQVLSFGDRVFRAAMCLKKVPWLQRKAFLGIVKFPGHVLHVYWAWKRRREEARKKKAGEGVT